MTEFAEIVKVVTTAVIVPLAGFCTNWIYRSRMGYSQTAAADFLLAVIIFDAVVVLTSQDFEPFLRSPELRPLLVYWHFIAAFLSALVWVAIIRFAEPALTSYYEAKAGHRTRTRFPGLTFVLCWMAILGLIAVHVGFFVVKQGDVHG